MIRLVFLLLLALFPTALFAQDTTIIGPDTYPEGISPLTGLPVDDTVYLERRPLNIKISNSPAYVRPQSGLNSADIVWEHLVEGGVTRFTAIFYSHATDHVGPVRSARLVDIPLTRIYGSLFVHSGSSNGTLDRLRQDSVMPSRNFGGGDCPPLCRFPQEGLAFEHTLYGDTEALHRRAAEIGLDTTPDPITGMAFSTAVPAGGQPVTGVNITYRNTETQWTYESGRWLRAQDDEPHFDALTSTQVNAANVVVLEADHIEQPIVYDGYWGAANYAFEVDLTGSGHIYLFRDGQIFEGQWRRDDDNAPLRFFDWDGNILPFKPGTTFFNLVPRWADGYQLTIFLSEPLTASVVQDSVILRNGPGQSYGQKTFARRGDSLTLIGRDWRGGWAQVLLPDNTTAWVSAALLNITGDLSRLPAVRSTFE